VQHNFTTYKLQEYKTNIIITNKMIFATRPRKCIIITEPRKSSKIRTFQIVAHKLKQLSCLIPECLLHLLSVYSTSCSVAYAYCDFLNITNYKCQKHFFFKMAPHIYYYTGRKLFLQTFQRSRVYTGTFFQL
jgi:hypothetical protein